MSINLKIENILIQVRSKLSENKIKLWLSPYYSENGGGPCEIALEERIFIYFKI